MSRPKPSAAPTGHTPPANPEAEQSVLGAILLRPQVLNEISDILEPEDFYREAHARIYRVMVDLAGRGDPVDLVSVNALLKERGQLEEVGGPVFLVGLSEQVGFATNADYYARLVHDKAVLRRLLNCSQEIAGACITPIENVQKFLQEVQDRFRGAIDGRDGSGLKFAELTGYGSPVSELLSNPPPARDYLLEEVLATGIVGGIVAVGGTGKGFFNILLGLSLATGQKIGPLEPARQFKVLYLAGEDDQEELDRRTISAVEALWPDGSPPPEVDNFTRISVAGKLGPLMQLDRAGNPVNAPAFDWLCKTLANLPDVEVLILDPKSKFYGLVLIRK